MAVSWDNQWVRGYVLQTSSPDSYRCALIDWGQVAGFRQVHRLPVAYHDVPEFISIGTTDPSNVQYFEKGVDLVCQLLPGRKLSCTKPNGQSFEVSVTRWDYAGSVHADKKQPEPSLEEGDVVMIVGESDGHLHVRTRDLYNVLKKITAEIGKAGSQQLQATEASPGRTVLTTHPTRMGLFRAEILSSGGSTVELRLLDFGTKISAAASDLRAVPESLASTGPATIRVKLVGVDVYGPRVRQELETIYAKSEKFEARAVGDRYEFVFKNGGGKLSERLSNLSPIASPQAAVAASPSAGFSPRGGSSQESPTPGW